MHLNTTPLQEQMWSEYRTRLHRFILKRINNPVVAEDLVQEILAKAYSQLDQLRDREKLLPWMYQATRNAIVDYYRKKKPAKRLMNLLPFKIRIGMTPLKRNWQAVSCLSFNSFLRPIGKPLRSRKWKA